MEPMSFSYRERLAEKLGEALSLEARDATPRLVHGPIVFPGKATAVIGMRRAGKTTFMLLERQKRMRQGVPAERLIYVNFEDERLAGLPADQLHFLTEEYYRCFPAHRKRDTVAWFFDEIHSVPGWERFIRRLLDTEKADVFISGSSAALLSRELATAMRGRSWEVVIHPFGFEEYLRHHKREIPGPTDLLSPDRRSTLERAFLDYLYGGGFPEAQHLDSAGRRQLLLDYVDVTILRDVVERHKIGNFTALRWLVRQLLGNAGGLFSVEKFYAAVKSQGIAVSRDSLHEFVSFLQDCFLVRGLWMEAESERKRMVNPRKFYPIDPALIPLFDRTGRANRGHALETAVFLELERRRMEITYVRTPSGREVDFLVRDADKRTTLIQTCADMSDQETAKREFLSLEEAGRIFPQARRLILTLTAETPRLEVPEGITVEPAYAWILGKEDQG